MIIRAANPADAADMAAILNQIIAIGGTTAHQHPKSVESVRTGYIDGPDTMTCVVAQDHGQTIGWQSVGMWHGVPHIGTFVRPGLQARGTGAGLFAMTCDLMRGLHVPSVFASIRADNVPGLAFYARAGFVDVSAEPDFALEDGRIVGRVLRQFDL